MNDLQQSFFFISQGGLSLDDYYAQFCGLCEELNICEPISSDIQTMSRQQERESMQVARFLSAVHPLMTLLVISFGDLRNYLLLVRSLVDFVMCLGHLMIIQH